MKIIGIICEYNPLHNGHIYHLNKIKEQFKDSLIILVLNGYFCERGDISIINKQDKTYLALLHGIDIVVELPFVFGTQSADKFSDASIFYLESLGCDYVIFGSESNDLESIDKITDYMINNKDYEEKIAENLKQGYNYPTSLAKSLNTNFKFLPNDLLGISYLKSIKLNNYKIKPLTIKRTNSYLDTSEDNNIISATNIRNRLLNKENISKYIPNYSLNYIKNIDLNNLFSYLKYKIITDDNLNAYLDVDEGIEYRLKKVVNNVSSIEELIEKTKSKRYTYNKIKRMLIHILIGFTKKDNEDLNITYLKILGFNELGKNYLNKIKKELKVPLIPDKDSLIYKYELKCASIYDLITKENNLKFELSNKPIYLKESNK